MEGQKQSKLFTAMIGCILLGVLTGAAVGTVIFFFKLIAERLEHISHNIYELAAGAPLYTVLVFAGLLVLAVLMYFLHTTAPEIKGGGIPRATGVMRGLLKFRAARSFIGTLLGSWISFFAGLPLGSEGPSVLVGTSLGAMISPIAKKSSWRRYISTAGAGAGFAVATGAPLAAILFILEEVHRRMTVSLVLITSASAISAALVNQSLCGLFGISPLLFASEPLAPISLVQVGYILLLALAVAASVWLFDICMSSFRRLMNRAGGCIPALAKLVFVFMLVGIVGMLCPSALYGGRAIVLELMSGEGAFGAILLLLLWRFSMMVFTSNSGATGGSFVPTLCIGALVGAVTAELLVALGMPQELYVTAVLIAMCAFLGGTLRAPLTAVLFFVEATGQSNNLIYAALAVFVVHFVTIALGRHSFNDIMLEEMISDSKKAAV